MYQEYKLFIPKLKWPTHYLFTTKIKQIQMINQQRKKLKCKFLNKHPKVFIYDSYAIVKHL